MKINVSLTADPPSYAPTPGRTVSPMRIVSPLSMEVMNGLAMMPRSSISANPKREKKIGRRLAQRTHPIKAERFAMATLSKVGIILNLIPKPLGSKRYPPRIVQSVA
jgi:hypothetical protein